MKPCRLGGAVIAAVLLFAPAAAAAQVEPQRVAVDATDVARGILHATLSIPVTGGPQTLVYPRWIPGEHAARSARSTSW